LLEGKGDRSIATVLDWDRYWQEGGWEDCGDGTMERKAAAQ
jgi:hypothetical protein